MMSSVTPKYFDAHSLSEAVVRAYVAGGMAKPALPEGDRDEVAARLVELLVDEELVHRYARALEAERVRRGVDRRLFEFEAAAPELPVEEIAERGLSCLDDDQLAALATDSAALATLHDLLLELYRGGRCGEFWEEAFIDRIPVGEPSQAARDWARDFLGRQKAKASRAPSIRCRWVDPWIAVAIAASLLIGVAIGRLAFWSDASPSGGLDVVLASATPKFVENMRSTDDDRSLFVDVGGERPGFATVIALAPDRRQRVFPESGDDPLRVDPSRPEAYGPLPPESTILLVLITERPATEAIRDALLGKDFRANDLYRVQDTLRLLLSESGHRWVGLGVAPVVRPEDNGQ